MLEGTKKNISDILIIGSGVAGLYFALKLSSKYNINIISKSQLSEGSTDHAQGGIATVIDPLDNFKLHIEDTLTAGAGLCNPEAVKILVENGPDRIKDLEKMGMDFSLGTDGSLDLGREGGHRKHRIVHAHDHTGHDLEKILLKEIAGRDNIKTYPFHQAIDLITSSHLKLDRSENECLGAYVYDIKSQEVKIFTAGVTFLATGGAGQVYQNTTSPRTATGDGIAMAYRAGCRIANMEFMQFHPTVLYNSQENGRAFLISEALRGAGAHLKNEKGERFMNNQHPLKELAPRDIVARAIDKEMKQSGAEHLYLDATHIDKEDLLEEFPLIYENCKKHGIDITKDLIPIVPAAHYTCGGIMVDTTARTDIKNLFSNGETAYTGVHGANRLASNSLLEGLVFSYLAAEEVNADSDSWDAKKISENADLIPDWENPGIEKGGDYSVMIKHNTDEIQKIMQDYVGIIRSDLRLENALKRIDLCYREIRDIYSRCSIDMPVLITRNLALTSQLIIRSALARHESRGLHFSVDYPEARNQSSENTILVRKKNLKSES